MNLLKMYFDLGFGNTADDEEELDAQSDVGGLIIPKQTCEHVAKVHLIEESRIILKNSCADCQTSSENWFCLSCGKNHCSRYINNHGEEHWLFTLLTDNVESLGHCLTISLEDFSVWCYSCESYIIHNRLKALIERIVLLKTNDESPKISEDSVKNSFTTLIAIQDPFLLENLKSGNLLSACYTMKLRSASIDDLGKLHSSDYVNTLVSAEKHPSKSIDSDCSPNKKLLSQARISAGTTIDLVQRVFQSSSNGFALLTCAGHQAMPDRSNSTSIYNNIALAIKNILKSKPKIVEEKPKLALIDSNNHLHLEGATPIENAICHMINAMTPGLTKNIEKPIETTVETDETDRVERVFVIDLTSQHGQGLQSIFYESDQVFYASIHSANEENVSNFQDRGSNQGIGFNLNIPLDSIDSIVDQDILQIFEEIFFPLIKEFAPGLIIFAVDYQLSNLTPNFYAFIIDELNRLMNEKLVVILDGDLSNIQSKSSFVRSSLLSLLGQSSIESKDLAKRVRSEIHPTVLRNIQRIRNDYQQFWTCFQ